MKNQKLKAFYNSVYSKGEEKHYTKLLSRKRKEITEEKKAIISAIDWKKKDVIDIGCGTGELAGILAGRTKGKVVGIDYSGEAIAKAKKEYSAPNLSYICEDVRNIKDLFDIAIMAGTLEHMDDPFGALTRAKKNLKPKGSILITCPNWSNPRGYILIALKELFGAKITLADLHYLTPLEFIGWSKKLKMKLVWKTIEMDWGCGEKMVNDLKRRLPNVLKDFRGNVSLESIERFVGWLSAHLSVLIPNQKSSGAVGFYHFKKI